MANPLVLTKEACDELKRVCEQILEKGKGIIAADEPVDNIGEKLKNVGLENTEENRRRYRQLLVTCDKEFSNYVSAIILDKETFYQKTDDGTRFVDILNQKGILPGINVDGGLVELPYTEDFATQGLDRLHVRCEQYKKDGAKFAKWRVAYKISKNSPTQLTINDNANTLARYAATCQLKGLVPIVEPDVMLDGEHDLETCQKVHDLVLAAVRKALFDHHVYLEGIILKVAFVTPGASAMKKASPEEIAKATITSFLSTVPVAVPGIAFLSGGHSEQSATDYLRAVVKEATKHVTPDASKRNKCQWVLTFCYGRALQATVWKVWAGKDANVKKAQEELIKRAKANSMAAMGQ